MHSFEEEEETRAAHGEYNKMPHTPDITTERISLR